MIAKANANANVNANDCAWEQMIANGRRDQLDRQIFVIAALNTERQRLIKFFFSKIGGRH